ncbi:MAG: F0F1 ATP synthase subunit delta [Promethearchaeia archaeon]
MVLITNDDKKYFGKLGIFLIKKAKKEIVELNKQTLFQKTEIRKRMLDAINQRSTKMRSHFKETYLKFLNNSLSSTINEVKEKSLKLENFLLKNLKKEIRNNLKLRIQQNFEGYQNYLIDKFKTAKNKLNELNSLRIILNHRDSQKKSLRKTLRELFEKGEIKIKKAENDFIGGFKIQIPQKNLTYDFTMDTAIKRSNNYVETQFSQLFCDAEIKRLENEFIDFINNQRSNIQGYLEKYDRI